MDISDEIMERAKAAWNESAAMSIRRTGHPWEPIARVIMEAEERGAALKSAELKLAYDQLEAALADAAKWKAAASELQDLIATPVAILQEQAAAAEREECAKVADARADVYAQIANEHEGTPIGDSNTMRCGAAAAIADAIRARGA